MTFVLAEQLAKESHFIATLSLCEARLFDDAALPWIILVPRASHATEWIDLSMAQQMQAVEDINVVSHILKSELHCDKINIASLGNIVPQLHIHVIGRFHTDPLWPAPAFGKARVEYDAAKLDAALTNWRGWLK